MQWPFLISLERIFFCFWLMTWVVQLDQQGASVATHESIVVAARAFQGDARKNAFSITKCIGPRKQKKACGFAWRKATADEIHAAGGAEAGSLSAVWTWRGASEFGQWKCGETGAVWACKGGKRFRGAKLFATSGDIGPWEGEIPHGKCFPIGCAFLATSGRLSRKENGLRTKGVEACLKEMQRLRLNSWQKMVIDCNRCEHGQKAHHCKKCGGKDVCEHDRVRSACHDCGNRPMPTKRFNVRTKNNGKKHAWRSVGRHERNWKLQHHPILGKGRVRVKWSVGDFFETEKGAKLLQIHDWLWSGGCGSIEEFSDRVFSDLGFVPEDYLPSKYDKHYLEERLQNFLLNLQERNAHRHDGNWKWAVSVITRRLLFRLSPKCMCGARDCGFEDTSDVPAKHLTSVVEFHHFRSTKDPATEQPHKLFMERLLEKGGEDPEEDGGGPVGTLALEKIRHLVVVLRDHHDRKLKSTTNTTTAFLVNNDHRAWSQAIVDRQQRAGHFFEENSSGSAESKSNDGGSFFDDEIKSHDGGVESNYNDGDSTIYDDEVQTDVGDGRVESNYSDDDSIICDDKVPVGVGDEDERRSIFDDEMKSNDGGVESNDDDGATMGDDEVDMDHEGRWDQINETGPTQAKDVTSANCGFYVAPSGVMYPCIHGTPTPLDVLPWSPQNTRKARQPSNLLTEEENQHRLQKLDDLREILTRNGNKKRQKRKRRIDRASGVCKRCGRTCDCPRLR